MLPMTRGHDIRHKVRLVARKKKPRLHGSHHRSALPWPVGADYSPWFFLCNGPI